MRRRLLATGMFATGVIAIVSIGSGAVTNAEGGLNAPSVKSGDVVTSTKVNPGLGVSDLGNIALVANGTTTKTLVKGGCSVANLKTWWNNYFGGAYDEDRNTSWNVPGSCGDPYGNFQLQFISNNGNQSGWFTQSDGETIPQDLNTHGTATSKVKLGFPDPDGSTWCYYYIVTAPWGTDQVIPGPPCP